MLARKVFACLTIACGLLSLGTGSIAGQDPLAQVSTTLESPGPIDIVELEGLIDPPLVRYITDRIAAAERDGAQAVIFRLDVPGDTSVDRGDVVGVIEDAEVATVAWVAPRGAKAIGLGGSIAAASDAFYRAAETTVSLGADAGASDAGAADASALPSAQPAASLGELLQALDGTNIGGRTIESWDPALGAPRVVLRFQELPLWDRLLHAVVDPEVALFLILLGAFGLIFEVYNPGIGIAALLGAALLGLGFYSLDVLPTNWWALLVIVAALAALIYDVHVAGFGIWTIGGLAALGVGSWLLFPGGNPALDVGPLGIIAALVLSIVFFVSVMTAALRVRLRRPIDDVDGIVGNVAEAQTDIAPEGTVLSNGTLWRARTMETGIAAGEKVQVKATEGLVLLVEPWHDEP